VAESCSTLSPPEVTRRSLFSDGMVVIWAIALAKLALHIYFNNRYGYFRDEFDYMACGDHLQWGYVDQPPLVPLLLHLCRAGLGDSLRSIRFFPAVASSLLVVQSAVLARELGGRRYAVLLTAICIALAPQYLSNGSLLTTNYLEPNLWMGCVYFAVLAIKQAESALLVLVWRDCRDRPGGEIFDCGIRTGYGCGSAADRASPCIFQ